MSKETLLARGLGKWGNPTVPKDGWELDHIDDLGEPAMTCEMCEAETIRYVHYMEHDDYDEVLMCGCICSGYMQGDMEAAVERQSLMKNTANRNRYAAKKEAEELAQAARDAETARRTKEAARVHLCSLLEDLDNWTPSRFEENKFSFYHDGFSATAFNRYGRWRAVVDPRGNKRFLNADTSTVEALLPVVSAYVTKSWS